MPLRYEGPETRIWLKSIEASADGESYDVCFSAFRARSNQHLPFTFKVKRSGSLDTDVAQALSQFRELISDLQQALAESQPYQHIPPR